MLNCMRCFLLQQGGESLRWSVRVANNKIMPYGLVLCTKKQIGLKIGESEKLCVGKEKPLLAA